MPISRNLSRERIVDAAFATWGASHFSSTSLQSVAQHLGVTKPAVYRYFRGKAELLEALRHDFVDRYLADFLTPLAAVFSAAAGDTEPTEAERIAFIRTYLDGMLRFYEHNPFHYSFFAQMVVAMKPDEHPRFANLVRREEALLVTFIPDPVARRFLQRNALFWSTEHFRRDPETGAPTIGIPFVPERHTLSPERRAEVLDLTVQRVTRGFLAKPFSHQPRIDQVERTAWLQPQEMPDTDRVFTAIEEVVQEIGYSAATVERIAQAIGITKSSLYHYFNNRDQMLSEVLLRDQRHFAGLAHVRFAQLEHREDQFYALFVMMGSYATQHSAFMTVENWLRQNEVTVQLPERHLEQIQEIFHILLAVLADVGVAATSAEALPVLGFIRFALLQELNSLPRPITQTRCLELVRHIFSFFVQGIVSRERTPV